MAATANNMPTDMIRLERNHQEVFAASADLKPSPLVQVAGRDCDIRIPLAAMGIVDSRATRITIGDAQWPTSAVLSIAVQKIHGSDRIANKPYPIAQVEKPGLSGCPPLPDVAAGAQALLRAGTGDWSATRLELRQNFRVIRIVKGDHRRIYTRPHHHRVSQHDIPRTLFGIVNRPFRQALPVRISGRSEVHPI